MYCPKCGSENTQEARFCARCGTKIEQPSSVPLSPEVKEPISSLRWYHKTWAIISMLVFFPPAGMIMAWKSPRWSRAAKLGATLAGLFWLGVILAPKERSNQVPEKQSSLPAVQPKTAPTTRESSLELTEEELAEGSIAGRPGCFSSTPLRWTAPDTFLLVDEVYEILDALGLNRNERIKFSREIIDTAGKLREQNINVGSGLDNRVRDRDIIGAIRGLIDVGICSPKVIRFLQVQVLLRSFKKGISTRRAAEYFVMPER